MSGAEEIKAAIGKLLEKARRSINTANAVRAQDPDSAVSCLYYAMFYCATALLLTKGLGFSKHTAVIAAFGQHFAKTKLLPPELHRWLQDAFAQRNVSDYELAAPPAETIVAELQSRANQFLVKTEEFLKQAGHL